MTGPAERKKRRMRRPSPALVVALLALFVSLSGTAVAAGVVPLAKRALVADRAKTADKAKTADNANKLGGLTAAQVGSLAPPPNVYYKTMAWTLAAGDDPRDFTVSCDPGQHVIGGGYDNPDVNSISNGSHPSPDGLSWVINLENLSPSSDSSGTLYAVCLR
jgi:hypothetical protein